MTLTNRQEEILKFSVELISEGGIQNLTTNNLSKKLGISEAALYRHFRSKLDILIALLDQFEEVAENNYKEILNDDSVYIEKARKIFVGRCELFVARPQLVSVIFSEEIFRNEPELSKKVYQTMIKNQKFFQEIISKAIEHQEIRFDIPQENLCLLIMGALRLLVTRWRLSNYEFDLVERAKSVWNSIFVLITVD